MNRYPLLGVFLVVCFSHSKFRNHFDKAHTILIEFFQVSYPIFLMNLPSYYPYLPSTSPSTSLVRTTWNPIALYRFTFHERQGHGSSERQFETSVTPVFETIELSGSL